MKSIYILIFSLLTSLITLAQNSPRDTIQTNAGDLIIQPILHGTLVMEWNNEVIYVDPYGGIEAFEAMKPPTMIFITDIHGDHLNMKMLKNLDTENVLFVAPKAVIDLMSREFAGSKILEINNGEIKISGDITIVAVPMYNLPEDSNSRHPKGRGNGYVINLGSKNIYISGDTEDIPEMRNLNNIDIAFVCMNLPYTMDINQAASAVLDFKPTIMYPYHYRGKDGLSDVYKFKELVTSKDSNIDVRLRNWYPE